MMVVVVSLQAQSEIPPKVLLIWGVAWYQGSNTGSQGAADARPSGFSAYTSCMTLVRSLSHSRYIGFLCLGERGRPEIDGC